MHSAFFKLIKLLVLLNGSLFSRHSLRVYFTFVAIMGEVSALILQLKESGFASLDLNVLQFTAKLMIRNEIKSVDGLAGSNFDDWVKEIEGGIKCNAGNSALIRQV